MRLQIRNMGTDAKPDLQVFTEDGEWVQGVTAMSIKRGFGEPTAVAIEFHWIDGPRMHWPKEKSAPVYMPCGVTEKA